MAFWSRRREVPTQYLEQRVAEMTREIAALRESTLDQTYDPDQNLSSAGGGSAFFRRLSSQGNRDFSVMDQERQLQTARWLIESNPLARRAVALIRDFVIGDGVELRAQEDDQSDQDAVQGVLDAFWTHPTNRLDTWLHELVYELGYDGELCLSVHINPVDGSITLGHIDVAEVVDVLLDRQDRRTPLAIACRKVGAPTEKDYYRVIAPDLDPASPTFGRMMPAASGDGAAVYDGRDNLSATSPYAGSVFFWRINCPTGAKRGRSDLLSVADWADGVDQHLFGELDRAALMKAFIWDVTVEGATETELKAFQAKQTAPKPGSQRYHNDKTTWNAVTPDLKTVDAQILNDMLHAYTATGVGLPKTWLNGTVDVNRASAVEMGEPAIKSLTQRQRYVRECISQLITFVLDQAEIAGRLPMSRVQPGTAWPEAWHFAVQMPEIRTKDLKAAGDTMAAMVQALTTAHVDHAIDLETYQEVMALLVGQVGIDVDLEAMRLRIKKEQAEEDAQAAMSPYPADPTQMQPGQDMGQTTGRQPQPAGATP